MESFQVDPGQLQGSFAIVSRNSARGEPVEAVPHDEELECSPSRLRIFESIGIVDLAGQLPDDSLHEVGVLGHPRVIEVCQQVCLSPGQLEVFVFQPPTTVLGRTGPELEEPPPDLSPVLRTAESLEVSQEGLNSRLSPGYRCLK